MRKTIAVALSGGVDSLVAATLLKEQGHDLVGLHFLTGYEAGVDATATRSSSAIDRDRVKEHARERLVRMTASLQLPIYIIDLHREFKSLVVDYFSKTYRSGRTPNPCLVCNPSIKYGRLLDCARSLGATHLATGHYARIRPTPDGRFQLLRGQDPAKEQSYFLARLTQRQLAAAVMPLGDWTKDQTRRKAQTNGLQPASSQESQDICFIRNEGYGQFLTRQPGFTVQPGPIEDTSGRIIGRHNGLHRFTIGQRRGINCPASEPYYVVRIDTARNCLIVGFRDHLITPVCRVSDINWIVEPPGAACQVTVRVRYRHQAVAARLLPLDPATADVEFETPQAACCPGQGAVFYRDDEVLGGGWIQ